MASTKKSEPKEETTASKKDTFVAWKVAIDIHNGVYGKYANQQAWAFEEAGFTKKQIAEAMAIADTIE